jgi:hypothetical protein
MQAIQWKRTLLSPEQLGGGDAVGQLFEGKHQIRAEIFVREDLQNRVDARIEGLERPVEVFITFLTLKKTLFSKYFPDDFRSWYLQNEISTLTGDERNRRTEQIQELFSAKEFPVLLIEDFNTSGLNGPINSRIPIKTEGDPLYHATNALTCFFRRNGISGKTNKKLGSAGLGRHVYYKASRISSKLIYTVPSDLSEEKNGKLIPLDPRPLFFGQSFQRTFAERKDNQQHLYDSYYHLSGTPVESLPMPYGIAQDEEPLVEEVRRDFLLRRSHDQTGCSIIIPFPNPELTEETFINSVVRCFALPILYGRLELQVNRTKILKDNIASLSSHPEVNQFNNFLLQSIRKIARKPDVEIFVSEKRLQRLFGDDLLDVADLNTLTQNFVDREIVCVKVNIEFGTNKDRTGIIFICLQKTEMKTRGRHVVSRDGLEITSYSDRQNFARASNAVVLVQPDQLGALLRSTENPAHTEWIAGDADPHLCSCPQKLIEFVKSAHQELERILTNRDAEDDLSVFADLIPTGRSSQSQSALDPPFEVRMEDDQQTFTILPDDGYESESGSIWRISLFYNSVFGKGRSRKSYRTGLYDLTTIPLHILGGRLVDRGNCHFDVAVDDAKKFTMSVGPCEFPLWADVLLHAERVDFQNEEES